MTLRALALAIVVAIGLAALIVAHGAAGLLYVLIFALAAVPGLPLGFTLFGSRQPAGWIAGALLGYVLTSFAIWVPIAVGRPSRAAFALVWLVALAVSVLAGPPPRRADGGAAGLERRREHCAGWRSSADARA